jgi:hypothetical protein
LGPVINSILSEGSIVIEEVHSTADVRLSRHSRGGFNADSERGDFGARAKPGQDFKGFPLAKTGDRERDDGAYEQRGRSERQVSHF